MFSEKSRVISGSSTRPRLMELERDCVRWKRVPSDGEVRESWS